MELLRTPDSAFANISDWAFEPVYTNITADDGTVIRVAHVDIGPKDAAETFLCMHGEPSWSYLYRKVARVLTGAGHRVIAPDLVGFGRSDKPTLTSDFTYERHVGWMSQWIVANDLKNLTLVCQDWGSLLGLRLATAFPDRFARIVLANGGLPTGDPAPNEAFLAWRKFSQETPTFPTSQIIQGGCAKKPLAPEVLAAYDAPYPDESYKSAARIFPTLVPASLDDPSSKANIKAWDVLKMWTKPFICAFSDSDPVSKNGEWAFRKAVPGAETSMHTTIVGGGHFLQEDCGEELANFILQAIA